MPPAARVTAPYRDYNLGARQARSPRRFGAWIAFALGVGAVAALIYLASREIGHYRALHEGVALARQGDLEQARARFAPLEQHRLFGPAARDGLGLVALLEGNDAEARRRFAQSGKESVRFWPVSFDELVFDLLEQGDYGRAEVLAAQARARKDSSTLRIYHGMALNGLDQLGPAKEAMGGGALRSVFERVKRGDTQLLGGILKSPELLRAYSGHVKNLVEKERTGRRAYLYDGAGRPLIRFSLKTGEPLAADAAVRSFVFGPAGASVAGGISRLLTETDRRNRVETTIDAEVQRAAYDALRNQRGSVVVLAADGAVLAAASRDDRRTRARRLRPAASEARDPDEVPDPFATFFDAASVSKVPALLAALSLPADPTRSVFPLTCKGNLRIADTTLYDWRPHGHVAGFEQAMAVSCNIGYAELGLRVGASPLVETFHGLGFDGAAGGPLTLRPLGRLARPVTSERDVADLAVGLGIARATTAGAAAVALAVASGGEWREPYVVRQKSTLGGRVYARTEPSSRRLASAAVAKRVTDAMVRVVTDEEGTGRRAQPERLSLAAKTGTSGSDRAGFDAVVVGFAPAEAPRYAFAVYLHGSGRAEWDGAFAAKALVDSLRAIEEDRARAKASAW